MRGLRLPFTASEIERGDDGRRGAPSARPAPEQTGRRRVRVRPRQPGRRPGRPRRERGPRVRQRRSDAPAGGANRVGATPQRQRERGDHHARQRGAAGVADASRWLGDSSARGRTGEEGHATGARGRGASGARGTASGAPGSSAQRAVAPEGEDRPQAPAAQSPRPAARLHGEEQHGRAKVEREQVRVAIREVRTTPEVAVGEGVRVPEQTRQERLEHDRVHRERERLGETGSPVARSRPRARVPREARARRAIAGAARAASGPPATARARRARGRAGEDDADERGLERRSRPRAC